MAGLTGRRAVIAAGGLGLGAIAAFAGWRTLGGYEELSTAPVYAPQGVAIGGTDPVAYFTQGHPMPGTPDHALDWNGATWHFASAAHRAAFAADPARYAPQYGGFCAWAVAEKGKLYSTQPRNWAIVNDRLYLNYNDAVQATWQKDIARFVALADRRWPDILKAGG